MEKIFIDSSVIIENCKENLYANKLITKNNKDDNIVYINPIVVSEVAYILKKKLKYEIKMVEQILRGLVILPIDNKTIKIAYNFMQKYNMKPNDAIISANCKEHKIDNMLTMDDDFIQVCEAENINLINK